MTDASDDGYAFYTYKDLEERRIVQSRAGLSRLILEKGFPRPVKYSDARQSAARWRKTAVHEWLDSREVEE